MAPGRSTPRRRDWLEAADTYARIRRVAELRALGHGELELVLVGGARVALGRTCRDSVLARWPAVG